MKEKITDAYGDIKNQLKNIFKKENIFFLAITIIIRIDNSCRTYY